MYVKLRMLLLLILGQVFLLFSTFRAFSLDDKGNGVGIESCW